MKKIILYLGTVLSFIFSCTTHKEIISEPLVSDGGSKLALSVGSGKSDTLQYLKNNFEINKGLYVGKNLNSLMDNIKLPFKYCLYTFSGSDSCYSMTLHYNTNADEVEKISRKEMPLVMVVYWKKAVPMKELVDLFKVDGKSWTQVKKQYMGQLIISNIQVGG